MANFRPDIEPDVLVWARESIGLSLEEAAKKLGMSALDLRYLEEGVLEEGKEGPTIGQLRTMVEVYKRPLAVFFLPKPARDFDAMKDFRLLPGNEGRPYSPQLRTAFRRVHMQHEVAQELAESADEMPPPLDLSLVGEDNPEAAGEAIRQWLGSPVRETINAFGADRLNEWIELVEAKTVLVTQVVHVKLSEMRGCSISDQPFPIIMLNGGDSRRGRVFTLMHELVHLLMHSGGVCDLAERDRRPSTDKEQVERFCNHVAAAALMPRAQLLRIPTVARSSPAMRWSDEDLKQLADVFGVSREAMLLRLVELGHSSWDYYFERRPHFLQIYDDVQQERKDRKGGPGYYRMQLRNFGRRYTTTVLDAYYRQDITSSNLADYLDIKLNNLPGLKAELEKER